MIAAIRQGISYLDARTPDGRWQGFPTLAGTSDAWVTGFVAWHLAEVAPRSAAVRRARQFLVAARHPRGGWGYGPGVPADADSTAWCLAALKRSPALSADGRRDAVNFLTRHRINGGLRTYQPDSGIREYVGAGLDRSMDGWIAAHADVTAAALVAGVPRPGSGEARMALAWLLSTQTPAGVLEAYWWRGPYYTTAMTLRAFARHRLKPDLRAIERTLDLLDRKRLPGGGYGLGASQRLDAFSTALALESLTHLTRHGRQERRQQVAAELAAAQRPDGGWAGDMVLRIPAPDVVDPNRVGEWARGSGGGNSFVLDRDGIFATALACYALALHLKAESGEYAAIAASWPEVSPPAPRPDPTEVVVAVNNPPEAERC